MRILAASNNPKFCCVQEREAFIAEVVAERRRLAEENAAAARSAEEARANLLDLKTRVAQYEAQAAAALRQAHEEEAKATTSKEAAAKERATLDELKKELQVTTGLYPGPSTTAVCQQLHVKPGLSATVSGYRT